MSERNVLGEIRSPGNSASSFPAPRLYMVESPRASVKIPRRQGHSEASDQSVLKGTLRERAERERSMRGISTMQPRFWSLTGLVGYEEVKALQQKLVDLRAADKIPDTVLFLEHRPVITRGRGLQWTGQPRERHMPPPAFLPPGMEFCESERGGDLTYHGPGQLVMYPICKLDGGTRLTPHHDISAFLRAQESLLCSVLSEAYGLTSARTRENATGVWVGEESAPRKVASIGIAVRRWVIWHGIAINLTNSLEPFHLISPCGFQPEVMTSLELFQKELGLQPQVDINRAGFEDAWQKAWEKEMGAPGVRQTLSLEEALRSLEKD